MTGLDASGPILPSPNTAVPLVITPTKFPLAVTEATEVEFSWINSHA